MAKTLQNQYHPTHVTCPGEILAEALEERGMKQTQLAARMGRPEKTISEIINGKAALTPETALQLERVLNIPARFWNSLERNYRESLAQQAAQEQLQHYQDWARTFPYPAMAKQGWVPPTRNAQEKAEALLRFFGVASPDQHTALWQTQALAFRQSPSFTPDFAATTAWLRQGECQAAMLSPQPYSAPAFKQALQASRSLLSQPIPSIWETLVQSWAEAGVALVLVPSLKGVRASGVTRWLSAKKPLIQLSLRHKRDDHLWFTLFHESCHVLQEQKQKTFIDLQPGQFLPDLSSTDPTQQAQEAQLEQEADRFAESVLIPPEDWQAFRSAGSFTTNSIKSFANKLGIAPGIVVGRLRKEELIPQDRFQSLFQSLDWDAFNQIQK